MARNLTPEERDRIFGPLNVVGEQGADGLVLDPPPPLETVQLGSHSVQVHTKAADSLEAVANDLDQAGLSDAVREAVGFQPRLVRLGGGETSGRPSAHAYGAAVDVNFTENPVGAEPTGEQGAIAQFFERHGWFWGRDFDPTDPHHFAFQGSDPLLDDRSEDTPRAPSGSSGLGLVLGVGATVILWLMIRS